jgi:dTDP-4-amino-4,6-dideoxygalactose transaminase
LQKAYALLNYSVGEYPIAERVAAEIISLPMFPHLTAEQQVRVTDEIRVFTSETLFKPAQSEQSSMVSARLGA